MNCIVLLGLGCLATAIADTKVEQKSASAIIPLLFDEPRWTEIVDCLLDRGPCGKYQLLKDSVYQFDGNSDFLHTKEKDDVMKGKKSLSDRYPRDIEQILQKYSRLVKKIS